MKNRTLSAYLRRAPKQLFNTCLSLWLAFATCYGHPAFAQSTLADFKAPTIEHALIQSTEIGATEAFVATVVDDQELDRVSLFYRFTNESDYTDVYTETSMQQIAESSSYSTVVDTSKLQSTTVPISIEYYIRAEDKGGNVVLKGFAFEPLVRQLEPLSSTVQAGSAAPIATNADTASTKGGINWLYVALGALVVGGIAASAGGKDGPQQDCDPLCDVTLTFPAP